MSRPYSAISLSRFDFSLPFAVSLNRYEEKKNIELAIRSVARLPQNMKCNLIVAGKLPPLDDWTAGRKGRVFVGAVAVSGARSPAIS